MPSSFQPPTPLSKTHSDGLSISITTPNPDTVCSLISRLLLNWKNLPSIASLKIMAGYKKNLSSSGIQLNKITEIIRKRGHRPLKQSLVTHCKCATAISRTAGFSAISNEYLFFILRLTQVTG